MTSVEQILNGVCDAMDVLRRCDVEHDRAQAIVAALRDGGYVIIADQPDHRVNIDDDGWFIEHSIACRVAGTMHTCPATLGIIDMQNDMVYLPVGRFLITGYETVTGWPTLERIP